MNGFHLTQINIARARGPMDSPVMAGFAARLVEINALAEASPGFVWRLMTPEGDATSIRVYDDEMMLINMSVWESIDALFKFTYGSDHVDVFRQRGEWFERMDTPYTALWWVPAGHIPTPEEGKTRLEHLIAHGPTAHAFTFKQRFEPQEAGASD